ncbi:MAG: EamA family transporter RarD [Novipirellula sp. JB048]
MRFGLGCAIAAHMLWGLFPMYWRQLDHIDSMELVWHRVLWSFLLLTLLIPFLLRNGNLGGFQAFTAALRNRRVWAVYSLAGGLLAVNWFTFIWAVNHNRVLEASLGYYINPLLNVTLGVLVLGERLGRIQWFAVLVAAVGVLIMSIAGGKTPWISLVMAFTFAFYALIKAKVNLPSVLGLWFEMAVLFVPALFFISSQAMLGESAFVSAPLGDRTMLMAAGLVTMSPLLLFASAVRRINLSTIGILQYIGPTLQFAVGAFVYSEPLDQWRIIGFVFVWAGLAIYLLSPTLRRRFGPQPVPCPGS